MKGLLSANLPEKFASIVIAVLLWQVVFRIEQPLNTQGFDRVQVNYVNIPDGLMRTKGPELVHIDAHVTGPGVDSIDRDQLFLSVDMKDAKPGTNVYPIKKIYTGTGSGLIDFTGPKTAEVTLEEITTKEAPVRAQITGYWDGYKTGPVTVNPETVRLTGAKSQIDKVAEAVVNVNLKDVQPGAAAEGDVQIIGKNGLPIAFKDMDPQKVSVLVKPIALPPSKHVLIQPTWQGSPAIGYKIEKYEIIPNEVKLSGPADVLSSLMSVDTEKIDITGIDSTKNIMVPLALPPGVVSDKNEVRVRVVVKKDDGIQPAR